jgi:hypothetical protein
LVASLRRRSGLFSVCGVSMNHVNLRKWLQRERKRAVKLCAFAKGVGTDVPVNTWDKEELDAIEEPERVVLGACDDWVAQRRESTLFLFQWFDSEGHPITSCEYRMAPVEDGSEPPLTRNQIAADVSVQQIIAQFMRHDEQREKTLISALDSIFSASAATIASQQKLVAELQRQNVVLATQQQVRNETNGGDPEEVAEMRATALAEAQARARAWEKLEQLGPPLLQAVLARFGTH